jgi:hypothetical protein
MVVKNKKIKIKKKRSGYRAGITKAPKSKET